MTSNLETEWVTPGCEQRQGDIIQLDYPPGSHSGPSLGVIINADCDLAQGKVDGVIAYLPIYTFREYLTEYWLPHHLNHIEQDSVSQIVSLTKAGPSGESDLGALLAAHSPEEAERLLTSLPMLNGKKKEQIKNLLRKIVVIRSESSSAYDRFVDLCRQEKNPERHARKKLLEAKNAMGEGHFFVSEIVNRPEIGFVVRMRRIYSIAEKGIFSSRAQQLSQSNGNEVTAFRVARFTSLYRFKILQVFAQQFSRVGLPDEISSLGDLAIDEIVSHVLQVE